jgi:hypothetical protein
LLQPRPQCSSFFPQCNFVPNWTSLTWCFEPAIINEFFAKSKQMGQIWWKNVLAKKWHFRQLVNWTKHFGRYISLQKRRESFLWPFHGCKI